MTGHNEQVRSWDDVYSDFNRLVEAGYMPIPGYVTDATQPGAFEASIVSNARDLLKAAAANGSYPVATSDNPYMGSINFDWNGQEPAVSVEVLEDRYELCMSYQGRLDMKYVFHTPGDPVPDELLKQLRRT